MKTIISTLNQIINEENIQNSNAVIGYELEKLLQFDLSTLSKEDGLEEVLFSLINTKKYRISSVAANLLGYCLVLYFQSHKISHWKFVEVMSGPNFKWRLDSIVVLGLVSSTKGFKSQLSSLIDSLLETNSPNLQPFICQCFRRILKGTGTFLTKSVSDIFNYVSKYITSRSSDYLQVECFKTVSVLYVHAKLPIEQIIPLINQMLPTRSHFHLYPAAKSFAAIGCALCQEMINKSEISTAQKSEVIQTKGESKKTEEVNPFHPFFKLILDLSPNDSSISTISSSFIIFLRHFEPIFVIQNVQYIIQFIIELTSVKGLSLPSLSVLSISLLDALVKTLGDTVSTSICNQMFEQLNEKPLTASLATVAISTFVNFGFLSKIRSNQLSEITKYVYQFLSATRTDIRRLSTIYFGILAKKEWHTIKLFLPTFSEFFANISKQKEHEVDGFSRVLVYLIIYGKLQLNEFVDVCLKMIRENVYIEYSYLILSAIVKTQNKDLLTDELITEAFSNLHKLYQTPKGMKFCSIFINQFILSKQNYQKFSDQLIQYINSFIQKSSQVHYSSPTYLAFLQTIKELQNLWKQIPNLSSSISKLCLNLMQNYLDSNLADQLHPFSGQIDQINELYGVKIPNSDKTRLCCSFNTIYDIFLNTSMSSNRFHLIKEIETSFSTWVYISDNSNKKEIIPSLFKQPTLANILLIRSLLSRPKLSPFLPNDGLPFLLGLEASKDKVLVRLGAITAARWLKLQPELTGACLKYLEMPSRTVSFACILFSEMSKFVTNPNQFILIIINLIRTRPFSLTLYALSSFLKNCYKQISENINLYTMIISTLSKCAFSEILWNPSSLFFYKNCLFHLKSAHPALIFSLFNSPVFRNYSMLQAFELLKIMNSKELFEFRSNNFNKIGSKEIVSNDMTLKEDLVKPLLISKSPPPMILSNMFKETNKIEDVPNMFMLLQQTHLVVLNETLLSSVDKFPNMKFWTDMCKRIVIIKCVPPAERTNNFRIVPTRIVQICAMKIGVKLVSKMREMFPLELNCIDDIVSIAFNAIQINDRKIDQHSFAILSAILSAFIDVQNREGPLLNTYLSQFHPMLRHALDGIRALRNVADFVLSYLNFLAESHNSLLEEALKITEKGTKLYQTAILSESNKYDNLISLTRIKCRLFTLNNQKIENEKKKKRLELIINLFITLLCKNKLSLNDLKHELPDFVSAVITILSVDIQKIVLLFLLNELSRDQCPLSVLSAITLIINNSEYVTDEEIEYMVSSVAKNKDYFIQSMKLVKKETNQLFNNEDSLDSDTYFISKPSNDTMAQKSGYFDFLLKVSQIITEERMKTSNIWKSIFSLSIFSEPICFSAISVLIQKAKKKDNKEFLSFCLNSLPLIIKGENCVPFFAQLFDRTFINPQIADLILHFVVENISDEKIDLKYEIFRIGFRQFGEFDLSSIDEIAQIIMNDNHFIPHGINFVASLLVDKLTQNIGLNLLYKGIADKIVLSIPSSINSLPRILHFFNLALSKLKETEQRLKNVNCEEFEKSLIPIVFVALKLSANQKEKGPVLQPAILILKKMNPSIIKWKFENDPKKGEIIRILEPPKIKKAAMIELKTFGTVRQSNINKWQSLEIEDD